MPYTRRIPFISSSTTFVSDSFTDANTTPLSSHVGEIGATWTQHPSSAKTSQINSNAVRCVSGTSASIYYASGVPATADYDVQATVSQITASGILGVTGRVDTAVDTQYWATWNDGIFRWELYELVAGVATLLGFYAGDSPAGGDVVVKLQIRDAAKKVFLNGVERITSATNVITAAGRSGVRFYNPPSIDDSTGYRLDAFTAVNA